MQMMDPTERARKMARLNEAEKAYQDLMIGHGVRAVVDQNGERVEYAPASSARLAQYIQSLKLELGFISNLGPARPFW